METKKEIFQFIKEYLKEKFDFGENEIKPESHLVNDMALDSLDQADFFIALQEKFEVDPEDIEEENAKTIEDVCRLIEKYLQKKAD